MNTLAPTQNELNELASELAGRLDSATILRRREPMSRRTTLRVGGPADLYVEPCSEVDLSQTLRFARERKLPVMMLGRGSNLLVRDGGIRGLVLCLAHARFSKIDFDGAKVTCGAGARLRNLAFEAKKQRITGFEFLEGIPGSIGGALRMNAGAMGGWTFERVDSVRFMDFDGEPFELPASKIQVEYRNCPMLKDHIALSCVMHGAPGSAEEIETRLNECSRKRWNSQPAAPSAGCIFKNSLTIPAGKLIDELGLKGARVGGAVVSDAHGNFIVNDGNATARDVLNLIALIKSRAMETRGIDLHTEVEIVGVD